MTPAAKTLLAARGLSRSFGGLRAVAGLDLTVARGEMLGLIGPNGAGKTTVFNLLSGFLVPDSGDIRFRGRSIVGLPPHAICRLGLARTFQIMRPFPRMTVLENVRVGALALHPRASDALAHARDVVARVGLGARERVAAGALTLADRKRLELARALATRPRVLLLDEIAGGLTEPEVVTLVGVIHQVRRESIAIVWIEHVVHALRAAVDRLVAISFGRNLVDGPPDAVMADPEVRRVYLGIDVP
jgi:branched-chain amino acid transport system ATP-binding protein